MTTIFRATLEDAPAILALQHLAYESEAQLYQDWNIPPLTQTLAQLLAEFPSCTVLKASKGGVILGSVRAQIKDGMVQIGRLFVAPETQHQGIGSALLRAMEAAFPSAQQFELFTGSRSEGNIRLYARHGYSITQRKKLSPKVTLVFMAKAGAAAAPQG